MRITNLLAETTVRSVLSFELFINDDTLGALNFYSEHPHAFERESIELGLISPPILRWRVTCFAGMFNSAAHWLPGTSSVKPRVEVARQIIAGNE
jgi:hypothetical protein